MVAPVALFPKSESFHFLPRVAERCVSVRSIIQVQVVQFFDIGTHNLLAKVCQFLNLAVRLKCSAYFREFFTILTTFSRIVHEFFGYFHDFLLENRHFYNVSTNRISIDENDFLHVQRKQDIEEQNFVAPNGTLFLGLLMQPPWPLVLNQFVLEIVFGGHVRQEINELRRKIIFQEPKFDWRLKDEVIEKIIANAISRPTFVCFSKDNIMIRRRRSYK